MAPSTRSVVIERDTDAHRWRWSVAIGSLHAHGLKRTQRGAASAARRAIRRLSGVSNAMKV